MEPDWVQLQDADLEIEKLKTKIRKRDDEIERLRSGHCYDCCCAQAWRALGITDYTGRSIPEEIERLRKVVDAVRDALSIETQRAVVDALRELEES